MNTVVQPTSAAKLYPSTTATTVADQQHTASSNGLRSKRNSAANQRLRYLNEQTAHAKRESQHAATDSSDTVSVGQQSAAVAGNNAHTTVILHGMHDSTVYLLSAIHTNTPAAFNKWQS
jgi:sRNA-binding protein